MAVDLEGFTSNVKAGNWIAHQIRIVNDDSRNVFPKSAGSSRSYDKYTSIYHREFAKAPNLQNGDGFDEPIPVPHKKELMDGFFKMGNLKKQLFTTWCIPISGKDDRTSHEAEMDSRKQKLAHLNLSARGPTKRIPQRVSRQGSRGNIQEQELRSSLPQLGKSSSGQSHSRSRQGTGNFPSLRVNQSVNTPRVSATKQNGAIPNTKGASKKDGTINYESQMTVDKQNLEKSFQPNAVTKADEWIQKAPHADKAVISKVLRMIEKQNKVDTTLKKALLPDAKQAVDKWMQSASDNDRRVAVDFFSSLTGNKLMGAGDIDKKKRLQQIIGFLENGKAAGAHVPQKTRQMNSRDIPDGERFRFLRLLSPKTRDNRWMHTTWHHLPQYKDDDIVNNWSSVYTIPHAPIPRHFVIHPNWG